MPGRILSMQRQARELGRLRTGYTDTTGNKARPARSDTWIITSHAEHYVTAAAQAWGGDVEQWDPLGGGAQQWRVTTDTATLDAILPPGDPLTQAYELWSGGGCARRCDGITETLSDRPCLCRAEHGDEFHTQPKGRVCAATTRLNVFLPDLPDVGVWRVETHSYYAAQEIAGAVDLIRSAVGPDAVIPIRLRIEQRQRKAEGRTKNFPVVVVELRGITTGQVLGASVMGGQQLAAQARREAIGARGAPAAAALEAGAAAPQVDVDSVRAAIAAVGTLADLRALWPEARTAGLDAEARARAAQLAADEPAADEQAAVEAATRATAAQDAADPDELWARIVRTVPEDWTTSDVERDFASFTGTPAEQAGAADMRRYLEHLAGATA